MKRPHFEYFRTSLDGLSCSKIPLTEHRLLEVVCRNIVDRLP